MNDDMSNWGDKGRVIIQNPYSPEIKPKNTKVRIHQTNGVTFDLEASPPFDLQNVITQIRANGYLLIPGALYIPEAMISSIVILADVPPKPGESIVIPFPDKPA